MTTPRPVYESFLRPTTLRDAPWAKRLATTLSGSGIRPGLVSLAAVGFSLAAAVFMLLGSAATGLVGAALFLIAPVFVALRGVCDLVDGMMDEPSGETSDEPGDDSPEQASAVPPGQLTDRVGDIVLFGGAGLAAGGGALGASLGFAAAAMCVLAAHARVLSALAGRGHDYRGPMGMPTRLMVIAGACVASAIELASWGAPAGSPSPSLMVGCGLVAAGCGLTTLIRSRSRLR